MDELWRQGKRTKTMKSYLLPDGLRLSVHHRTPRLTLFLLPIQITRRNAAELLRMARAYKASHE